jgi:hypothetical protein
MVAVYGESAPSYYKAKFWSKQFKWGRESIEDDPHTGRPVEAPSEGGNGPGSSVGLATDYGLDGLGIESR